MNNFEYIRKHKNKKVKRNGLCLYDGQLMRMAKVNSGLNLVLRIETIVHPQDDDLIISANDDYMIDVGMLDKTKTIRELRRLVLAMADTMPMILPEGSFAKQWRKDADKVLGDTLYGIYVNEDKDDG